MSIIVTAHRTNVERILDNIKAQTVKPDVIVVYSDMKPVRRQGITYIRDRNRNDWGHNKRKIGLEASIGGYTAFFNSDDEYHPKYLEKLLEGLRIAQISYCDFNSHLAGGKTIEAHLAPGAMTSGNFIVETSIAQEVGYNHNEYMADWFFIKDMLDVGAIAHKVKGVWYDHN